VALVLIYGVVALLSVVPLDFSVILDAIRELAERLQSLLGFAQRTPRSESEGPGAISRIVQGGGTALFVGLLVGVVLLLTWYRARRQQSQGAQDEERDSLLSLRRLRASLHELASDGLLRAGQLVGLADRIGLRLLSALSIRRIYANLVRLAARNGYPRPASRTPFEYLALLYEAFPGLDDELQTITQAYVEAHYGQLPDSREELQHIRDAWHRVRRVDQARQSAE
jgi:hypothetical protein